MDVLRLFIWLLKQALIIGLAALRLLGRVLLWLGRAIFARRPTAHGSARWASWFDLVRRGAWGRRNGLIVAKAWGGFIRHRGEGAVLVYAPMGSGKGVGLVIPNLLDHSGSVICTDPKGENLAVTGRWRSTLGPVWRLDALHPDGAHRYNPLDLVRLGTHHEADDAAMIAELLVTPESADTHWDTSAKQLVTAVIRFVLHSRPKELRTLSTVREVLASDDVTLREHFSRMAAMPLPSIAEEGQIALRSLDSPEMTSVAKNAAKAVEFWSRDRIGGMLTAASDFDFLDMHRHAMTVFIVVPEDKLTVYRPFLRLMMGCAITAAVRGKELPPPPHKPLLLIDECAALGRLEPLEAGLGYLRSYVRSLLVFQDLGQLRRLYGDYGAQTFMAASGCHVAFNVNDNATARELAQSIGNKTELSRSHGQSQANTDVFRRQEQAGVSQFGRPLLDASEVRRLPTSRCLVFLGGLVVRARKVRHYREGRWRGRWDRWRSLSAPGDRDIKAADMAADFQR